MPKVATAYHVEIISDPNCPAGYYTHVFRIGESDNFSRASSIHQVVARNKDEALAKVIVALTEMNEGGSHIFSYRRVR